MGWKGTVRSIGATVRRIERHAAQERRAAERAFKASAAANAREAAVWDVRLHAATLASLESMHREAMDPINWQAIALQPAPAAPVARELPAPSSFLERVFTGKRDRAQQELNEAHRAALANYEDAVVQHREQVSLAQAVLAWDPHAFVEVVCATRCLEEVAGMLQSRRVDVVFESWRATAEYTVAADDIVPTHEKVLNAKGLVSAKKLSNARRMEIYEDYVCGSALRVARELMAATPVTEVLVHVSSTGVDPATGHPRLDTILSVLVPRDILHQINWDHVDASELTGRLSHRMQVKRGKGFQPVERLAV